MNQYEQIKSKLEKIGIPTGIEAQGMYDPAQNVYNTRLGGLANASGLQAQQTNQPTSQVANILLQITESLEVQLKRLKELDTRLQPALTPPLPSTDKDPGSPVSPPSSPFHNRLVAIRDQIQRNTAVIENFIANLEI